LTPPAVIFSARPPLPHPAGQHLAVMGEEGDVYQLIEEDGVTVREKGSKMFTGFGNATYPNKDTYSGVYVTGYRSGPGKYVFKANGDTYEGQFEQNLKHGFGKMTYKNKTGAEEEDEAEEGAPTRGGNYLGNFNAGKRGCPELKQDVPGETNPAEGTFTYVNGDIYVGQWKEGKKHGTGTYSYAKDSTKLIGEWEAGKMVHGKWLFPNGTFYSGVFRYNKPYGKGVWVFKDGNQLVGEFAQKEEANEDEGGGAAEGEEEVDKPDPKVSCFFKPGKAVVVSGGSMTGPKYAPTVI